MTYTDFGTKVNYDWMPLAMANGVEWMQIRRNHLDKFNCLYSKRFSLNGVLWYLGAIIEFVFRPSLLDPEQKRES